MTYKALATAQISLQTSGVTAEGFGIPLFATSHRYFAERVRSYSSLIDAAEELPTDSPAYKALQGYFSSTPRVEVAKIGRIEADLTLNVAVGSTGASVTVTASDGTDTFTVVASVSGQADEDAVALALAAAIEGDSDVGPLVVAAASGSGVTIDAASPSYTFYVRSLSSELSDSYTSVETAADVMANITAEDNDFYFMSADNHTEAFVLAMAADVEAREKIYFVSTSQAGAYGTYTAGGSTDIGGKLADSGYVRTKALYSKTADTTFPECVFVGYNAPYSAGSSTWNNLNLSLPASQFSDSNNPLGVTEKGNLEDRNMSYVESIGGLTILRNGSVAGGEKVDVIRGRDNLVSDIQVAYTNLLVSQRGSKIPYNNEGIVLLEGTVRSILSLYVTKGFINDNFVLSFPRIDKVSTSNKQARLYDQGKFDAELTGAIELVRIQGTLSLDLG